MESTFDGFGTSPSLCSNERLGLAEFDVIPSMRNSVKDIVFGQNLRSIKVILGQISISMVLLRVCAHIRSIGVLIFHLSTILKHFP